MVITIGLARMRILNIDIYFSQTFLYNSLIVLIIGIYLLIVGGLSKAIRYFNGGFSLPMETFAYISFTSGLNNRPFIKTGASINQTVCQPLF